MKILGVRIDNSGRKEILEKIEAFLNEDKFHQVTTVNPAFILTALRDTEFKRILNDAALNVADGIGLKYAFLRHGRWLKQRFAGVDLMHEILGMANKKNLSVFLAVNKNGLSSFEEIRTDLKKIYPMLDIGGDNMDPFNLNSYKIQNTKYEILLCNFGAPQQELFINSVKNDSIRLAMGVGGSFDFVTKKIKRAPRWMRNSGLEWLWRFIQEPRYRLRKIIRSAIVFPFKVLLNLEK